MRSRRLGPRLFALPVLAMLGLMAVGGAGVQAQLPGESKAGSFLLLNPGKSFAEEGLGEKLEEGTPVTGTGQQAGPGRFIVPGRAMAIGCVKFSVLEGKGYGTVAVGKARTEECTVWTVSKGEGPHNYKLGVKSPCVITNGQIEVSGKAVPILHGGIEYVLAEPLTAGTPFAVVKFNSGTGCPLPLTTEVSGSVVGLVDQGQVSPQSVTSSPAIQLLLGDKLLYGAFEAYMEGAATGVITAPEGFVEAPGGIH